MRVNGLYSFFLEDADEEDDKKKDKDKEEKESKDKKKKDDDDESDDFMSGDDTDMDDIADDLKDDDLDTDSSSSGGDEYNTLVIKSGNNCDCCSGDMFDNILKAAYAHTCISNNMKYIHLCACGHKFQEIHNMAEEFYHHFSHIADRLFELAAESSSVKLDNPTRAKEHCEDVNVESEPEYDFDTAISAMSSNIDCAIRYINKVRQSSEERTDIQSFMDEQLSYLNKQVNYFLRKRKESGSSGGSFDDTPIAEKDSIDIDDIQEQFKFLFR